MLKIKKIEFIKVNYDESLTQNFFSVANITFSNYKPISGALLYWQKNTSDAPFTKDGDYKFFYDMAKVQFFASVKFPKDSKLTRDQRQELAYILLEERGAIGSYSFVTNRSKRPFPIKQSFQNIKFPECFSLQDFNQIKQFQQFQNQDETLYANLAHYDRAFVESYMHWCQIVVTEHHSKLLDYLDYLPFSYICYANPFLSEQFLIDFIEQVDFDALQYNKPVLARLTASFKAHLVHSLKLQQKAINDEFKNQLEEFIESNVFFNLHDVVYLPEVDEIPEMELLFFEYDCGNDKWPGGEHLVKGIPSLYCQQYDRYGDKKLTNSDMDKNIAQYSAIQLQLFSGFAPLHWLSRYQSQLDWQAISQYNENLTADFLTAHLDHIDFQALGCNIYCILDEAFLSEHMNKFNHQQPVPLIICHLTEPFYLRHKDQIKVDLDTLYKYMDCIDYDEFERLESYF
ncbi:nucleoside-diphosphate sugar epimerase [Solibacillus sp. FSL K6-1523]|uniref:nucleoside-diphosphate sugar epimerase n=1 Tax=Solibacillus sp. FSL K6-1523 TaxID=2921471 RepID=UPI0030F81B38